MTTAILIIAALADAYTSHRLFKRGGVELNPLVKSLFGRRPSFGAMLAVKAVATAVVAVYGTPIMQLIAAAVWAAAAAWNWRIAKKLSK